MCIIYAHYRGTLTKAILLIHITYCIGGHYKGTHTKVIFCRDADFIGTHCIGDHCISAHPTGIYYKGILQKVVLSNNVHNGMLYFAAVHVIELQVTQVHNV